MKPAQLESMKRRDEQPDANESRAAVALTVVWMLACMSTAVGTLVVMGFRLLILAFPVAAGSRHPLDSVAAVLLFAALITGVACLAITPLVYRVRKAAPPQAITAGVVMISVAPIVLMVLLSLFRSRA